jgi:hypothetical protein
LQELDTDLATLFKAMGAATNKEAVLAEAREMLTDYVNALDHFKMEIRSQAPSDQSRFRAKGKSPVASHTRPLSSVCPLYVQRA